MDTFAIAKVLLELISILVILWVIYNYNTIHNKWRQKKIDMLVHQGESELKEINRITGYKGGQNE